MQDQDTSPPIVYVIDDDLSVRTSLADLLASIGLQSHCFSSSDEFLAHGLDDTAGCLVLDVRMPGQSGMDFQRSMHEYGLHIPVIFITGHGDIAMGVQAMKQGAIEFLTKPFRDQDLLDAIHRGINIDREQRSEWQIKRQLQSRWNSLTVGEKEVMQLVVQGLLNKQVAAKLNLSEVTIKVRRAQVMRKMQVRSLAELVRQADKLACIEND